MKIFHRKWKGGSAWVMDFRVGGVRRRIVLKGAKSREDARRLANQIWGEQTTDALLDSMAPREAARRRRERAGEALLGAWLVHDRERPGITAATRTWEAGRARHLVGGLGPTVPLESIDAAVIADYAKKREAAGAKPRTINMEIQCLQAAINRAVGLGAIDGSRRSFARMPEERERRRFLTSDEVDRLVTAMTTAGRVPGWFRDSMVMMANTGLRRSELFALRWERVDLEKREIRVRTRKRAGSGNYREHVLPMNAAAMEVLTRLRGKGKGPGYVFGREEIITAGKRERTNFGVILKRVAEAAGIDWFQQLRVHDLRHAFAMRLLGSGANMRALGGLMRHSSPSVTLEVYCHEDDASLREAVEALDAVHGGPWGDAGKAQNGHKTRKRKAQVVEVKGLAG